MAFRYGERGLGYGNTYLGGLSAIAHELRKLLSAEDENLSLLGLQLLAAIDEPGN